MDFSNIIAGNLNQNLVINAYWRSIFSIKPQCDSRVSPPMVACLFFVMFSIGGCANEGSGMQLSDSAAVENSTPEELSLTLLFEDSFDQQADFRNSTGVENCIGGVGNGCDRLPAGWTDFLVSEQWHPDDLGDIRAQPGLQINADNPRGGSGKSLMLWDESRGDPGRWGSDAMLGRYLPGGHRDLYVEFWIKFQPDYRWHHRELTNPPGTNLAKLLRIGHRDAGKSPFSFSASGSNAPLMFIDSSVWARERNGQRSNIASLDLIGRCDPQETNYRCGDFVETGRGVIGDDASFEQSLGDGNWHKVAARMALNSFPGAGDGIAMAWFDDELVGAASNVPFLGIDASGDTLLNMVTIGGNMHNYPEPERNQFEQWYAVDDVRIYAVNE